MNQMRRSVHANNTELCNNHCRDLKSSNERHSGNQRRSGQDAGVIELLTLVRMPYKFKFCFGENYIVDIDENNSTS